MEGFWLPKTNRKNLTGYIQINIKRIVFDKVAREASYQQEYFRFLSYQEYAVSLLNPPNWSFTCLSLFCFNHLSHHHQFS